MARVRIDGETLTLELSWLERIEGFHAPITALFREITSVRQVPDAWTELRGIRAPGTGLPRVIMVGTLRGKFGKDFAVVHGRGPAVVIDLKEHEFERLIFTTDRADEDLRALSRLRSSSSSPDA